MLPVPGKHESERERESESERERASVAEVGRLHPSYVTVVPEQGITVMAVSGQGLRAGRAESGPRRITVSESRKGPAA
jgi:hypothetical protein